jgi:hypothetical protein
VEDGRKAPITAACTLAIRCLSPSSSRDTPALNVGVSLQGASTQQLGLMNAGGERILT